VSNLRAKIQHSLEAQHQVSCMCFLQKENKTCRFLKCNEVLYWLLLQTYRTKLHHWDTLSSIILSVTVSPNSWNNHSLQLSNECDHRLTNGEGVVANNRKPFKFAHISLETVPSLCYLVIKVPKVSYCFLSQFKWLQLIITVFLHWSLSELFLTLWARAIGLQLLALYWDINCGCYEQGWRMEATKRAERIICSNYS
jgi:hypothetical protein